MERLKSEVLALLIGLAAIGFCISVYRIMKNKLARLPGSISVQWRNVQPLRKDDTVALAQSRREGWIKYWAGELISAYAILDALFRRLLQREVLLSAAGDLLVMAAVSVGMAMFCTYTDGGSDLYLTTFMTLMYVSAVLVLFARCVNGARSVYIPCCILILTGVALAVLLYLSPMQANPSNLITHPQKTVTFHVVAIICSIAAFPLLRMVCRSERRMSVIVILNVLIVSAYLFQSLGGEEVNGATNWIKINGFQFQITEIIKFLSMVVLALTLCNKQMKESKRFWCAVGTMAVNGVFLVFVCEEFGTLMIQCIVFLGLCLIYQKDVKKLVAIIVVAAVMLTAFLAVGKVCYERTYLPKTTEETTAAGEETAAEATTSESRQPADEPATSDTESFDGQTDLAAQNKLVTNLADAYKKVSDRFLVFLMPEKEGVERESYQWKMSREALVISDWFGSPYDISVPVARSDLIYVYMIVRLGVVFGFVVLALLLVLLCGGMIRCLRNPQTDEAAVAVAFLISMVAQSLIAAASSTGNFAIVGLPFMFLAYGGTAMVINYTMLVFLVYATGTYSLTADKKSDRRVIRRGGE